ncbi:hypothetical protein KP509_24G052900 [Ceratopteris richardii]|uniref:NUC153 domain-containing protein n=1 Tax=Ceratopteris richardii TaxID=49495 RepID=A0A8T2RXG3_CERRI|nr:hypothetical protein KP509_24G052900 [Ceratopteris richardii]
MKFSKRKMLEKQDVVRDPRFSRLHFDPRFQRAFKRKLKIPVDSRFQHIFSDKRFLDPLSLDKRGRRFSKGKQKHGRRINPLQQYYRLSDDDDEASAEKKFESDQDAKRTKNSASKEFSRLNNFVPKSKRNMEPYDSMEANNANQYEETFPANSTPMGALKTKSVSEEELIYDSNDGLESDEGPESESDSEDSSNVSSSSSSDTSSDEEEGIDDLHSEEVEEEKVPTTKTETRRLALVNMDWDHIRAVDILAVMNSFLPKGGQILSVSVYPSEFGLQQMKEEEKRGPQIFQPGGSDDSDEDEDVVMERLRKYEKDKLRYYYAVIECDSKGTADFIYGSCDGMEFERSANTFDLRFIPDEMKFVNDARDVAKEVPADYQVPAFETKALQHSRVKLTWDDDEPDRVKSLRQKFNADQLNEMDFKTYLASDISESESNNGEEEYVEGDEDENIRKGEDVGNVCGIKNSLREKYRALLLGSDDAFQGKDKSNEQDLEITFSSGLEELSKRLMEKAKQKGTDETVWEAYLRKKREKRRLQKQSMDAKADQEGTLVEKNSTADTSPSDGDAGFDDPFFNSEEGLDFPAAEESDSEREISLSVASKKKEGGRSQKNTLLREKKQEEERSKAELELLFADELASGKAVKGYNLKKKLKEKKKKDVDELPAVNYDDPRFSALFTSHRFAIDPTEPEFQRSAAQLRPLLEKQQKHMSQVQEVADAKGLEHVKVEDVSVATSKRARQELSLIVRSLKQKVGAAEG